MRKPAHAWAKQFYIMPATKVRLATKGSNVVHIYARNSGEKVSLFRSFPTRYACEKFLKQLRRQGRMTHFYVVSVLDLEAAQRRFAP
jgi:hypothetical protein